MPTFFNYCKSCPHTITVEDTAAGDQVCVDCGLVVDKVYMDRVKSEPSKREQRRDIYLNSTCLEKHALDILNQLCDKCHIDDAKLRWHVAQAFTDLAKSNVNKKLTSDEHVGLASIYLALIDNKVPRPLSHLCRLTNIDPKNVWRYIELKGAYFRPSLVCEYLLYPLELSYRDVVAIKKMVEQCEMNFVFAPRTLVASCAYIFLRSRKHPAKHCQISQVQISSYLDASIMAINRCVKKINQSVSKS